MTTLELKLTLPDELAQRAQSAGLLTAQAIEAMLREQLKKQAGDALRTLWSRLPREELTPELEQEIVEEVRAYRNERKRTRG